MDQSVFEKPHNLIKYINTQTKITITYEQIPSIRFLYNPFPKMQW